MMAYAPYIAAALLAVATAGVLARRACREGMTCAHIAAAATSRMTGTLVAMLALGHVGGVIAARAPGAPYDFRLYALLLLGATLLGKGIVTAGAARGIARGEPDARRRALAASTVLALVSAPLVPLERAASLVLVMALANLGALLVTRPHFAHRRLPTGFELDAPVVLRRVA